MYVGLWSSGDVLFGMERIFALWHLGQTLDKDIGNLAFGEGMCDTEGSVVNGK